MTEALERVIRNQQEKIDELQEAVERGKAFEAQKIEAATKARERKDRLYQLLCKVVRDHKINPPGEEWGEWVHDVRMHMLEDGWCDDCESLTCYGGCRDD